MNVRSGFVHLQDICTDNFSLGLLLLVLFYLFSCMSV